MKTGNIFQQKNNPISPNFFKAILKGQNLFDFHQIKNGTFLQNDPDTFLILINK